MALSSVVTIGSNLKPVQTSVARALSIALSNMIEKLNRIGGADVTMFQGKSDERVFQTVTTYPQTNTSTDNPGGDLCFIIDTARNDLYFVYGWSAASTFTCTKVLEAS